MYKALQSMVPERQLKIREENIYKTYCKDTLKYNKDTLKLIRGTMTFIKEAYPRGRSW